MCCPYDFGPSNDCVVNNMNMVEHTQNSTRRGIQSSKRKFGGETSAHKTPKSHEWTNLGNFKIFTVRSKVLGSHSQLYLCGLSLSLVQYQYAPKRIGFLAMAMQCLAQYEYFGDEKMKIKYTKSKLDNLEHALTVLSEIISFNSSLWLG